MTALHPPESVSSPRRVLWLNPWDRFIGPNRYLVELLRGLPDLAASATVVFHQANEARAEYEELGCRVAVVPEIAQVRARLSITNAAGIVRRHAVGRGRLARFVEEIHPDMMVSNTEQLLLGGAVARRLGIPHCQVFHALNFSYRMAAHPRLLRALLRFLGSQSRRVVAVSRTVGEVLVAAGLPEGKVFVVPNPIPVADLKRAAQGPLPPELEERLRGRGPILLNAGVLFPTKGQDQLVEALPEVKRHYPRMVCILAGRVGSDTGRERTGSYHERLLARISILGLEDTVFMAGETNRLPALMRRSDVYVQPSRTESFCRVVAEALVCGAPVVAFRVGAIPEAAGPGAVLVEPGDVPGLSRALLDLLADPEKRKALTTAGAAHVAGSFDTGKSGEAFRRLLDTILETGEKAP